MPSYPTRKTKNGTVYDVRFWIADENGAEVQKRLCGYPSKTQAHQAYLDYMQTYLPPIFRLEKQGVFIYDELFERYKKRMEVELAASSFYDTTQVFQKYITPYFTGKSLPTLTKADFSAWQTDLWAAKNPKNGTFYKQRYLAKIRSAFMTFLSWCEETYDIANLLKLLRKPKRKEMKNEMQFWELDEFLRFQSVVDNTVWKTFFMSLFYSGCRVGEILALTDNDVVNENGNYSFVINKGLTRKTSGSEQKYLVTAPKTSTSNRTVALPKVMSEQLNLYIRYKQEKGISGNFFFGGGSPIPQRTYQRYFQTYTNAASLKHIRIHDLRHSHASMLVHLNVPITVISKRLGHSSVKMTLERYSHCYSEGENIALIALNQAISNHSLNAQ